MLNAEKYKEDIEELKHNFCVKRSNNKIGICGFTTGCEDCKFSSQYNCDGLNCRQRMIKWLMSEYKAQKLVVDWTKVPIDTPVICYSKSGKQFKRHFAGFLNGEIYTWQAGLTSWTSRNRMHWINTKLAEPHPEWMMEVE